VGRTSGFATWTGISPSELITHTLTLSLKGEGTYSRDPTGIDMTPFFSIDSKVDTAIRKIEALVTQRKIRDLLAPHRQRQAQPVVE
jgi:hypothetical protein